MVNKSLDDKSYLKSLSELKAHELVECINLEFRKGRLYGLTDNGDKIVKV